MWIVSAVILHLLWLISIFVIYFRSPIIEGLRPQQPLKTLGLEAPANRLVLIITDGLRAESFFRGGCADIPHLRALLQRHGVTGISRTRVPTESRPGHIALIAGLYEDPSAVTRGWKTNPVDFDTVFNRSRNTYAWGANDILHIFSRVTHDGRMYMDAYDHDLDFSGSVKTYELDEWVFERVKLYLEENGHKLYSGDQAVYFLHLLGLDTAGHVHKPESQLFLENLHRTALGIYEMYELFERTFADGKTAYILTADHGMTNFGSHGSGGHEETDTPFFFWGAGIKNDTGTRADTTATFLAGDKTLPLHDMEQAQIAPLMATLLGVAPPTNNIGLLPYRFLNATPEYVAQAAYTNARQILEQFQSLLTQFERGLFSAHLRSFYKVNRDRITVYHAAMAEALARRNFASAIDRSMAMMHDALEGIDYYHAYYKNVLLISVSATMVLWMFYLFRLLSCHQGERTSAPWTGLFTGVIIVFLALLLVFLVLQKVTFAVSFYITLPWLMWLLLLRDIKVTSMMSLKHQLMSSRSGLVRFSKCVLLVVGVELLVASFFERRLISLAFLIYNVYCDRHRVAIARERTKYRPLMLLLMFAVAVSLFPLLPPSLGNEKLPLTFLGALICVWRYYKTMNDHVSLRSKLVSTVGIMNGVICMLLHSQQIPVPSVSQYISWFFLVHSFTSLFVQRRQPLAHQLERIIFKLTALYVLFCTSYEPIFVTLLVAQLTLSLNSKEHCPEQHPMPNDLETSFRYAFAILLYTLLSFFGTGNIASVSSFDPNVVRCFLTTFSPFIIMALVILKLVIPVLIIVAIYFGSVTFVRLHERQIFICLLIICNLMGLNFLFLVRNRGSWLEIGSSISHFVIMEATTVVLLLITLMAKTLLRLNSGCRQSKYFSNC